MRKMIFALGIIAVIGLLFSACAPQKADTSDNTAVPQERTEGQTAEPASGSDTGAMADTGSQAAEPEAPQTQENVVPSDTGVTQEELDDLKKNIEGMEFEDLEGISG